jgi:hypothetical protein
MCLMSYRSPTIYPGLDSCELSSRPRLSASIDVIFYYVVECMISAVHAREPRDVHDAYESSRPHSLDTKS